MTSHSNPELELDELLQEFDDVVQELRAPASRVHCVYAGHLQQVKKRVGAAGDGLGDSGIEDLGSTCSSLSTSEEELSTVGISATPKAKLGDTSDLQNFIENLNKELADM